MQIRYLEIVTQDVDATCATYERLPRGAGICSLVYSSNSYAKEK